MYIYTFIIFLDCVDLVTNGSVCVSPNKCIIHFKPGHTYMETIKLLNMTDLTQIIEIKPLECKPFKFPYLTTVSCIIFM